MTNMGHYKQKQKTATSYYIQIILDKLELPDHTEMFQEFFFNDLDKHVLYHCFCKGTHG